MRTRHGRARYAALFASTVLLYYPSSLNAEIRLITYTGVLADGFDASGVFTRQGTSLQGQSFRAIVRVNDSLPGSQRVIFPDSEYPHSEVYGEARSNPILAQLTIHGQTFRFNTTGIGGAGADYWSDYQAISTYSQYGVGGPQPSLVTGNTFPQFTEIQENFGAYVATSTGRILQSVDYRDPIAYNVRGGDEASGSFRIYRQFVEPDQGESMLAYGTFSIDRVTTTLSTPNLSSSATYKQLALMSNDVYSKIPTGDINEYVLLIHGSTGSRLSADTIFATAYYSAANNGEREKIVIAVRGSSSEDFELRNGSFVTGLPTSGLSDSVRDVANLVGRLHSQFPDAQITLTGHSLGGAIAQIIGDATGLRTIAFDAPGGRGLFGVNAQTTIRELVSGSIASMPGSENHEFTNIRYYGDVVSKIGTPFDNVKTVLPSNQNDLLKIATYNLLIDGCALICHSPSKIIDELFLGSMPVDGIPDLSTNATLPVQGLLSILGFGKDFQYSVNAGRYVLYDPSGSGRTGIIDLDVLSVPVEGIYLPGFASDYGIEFLSETGEWIGLGSFDGFTDIAVPRSRSYRISRADTLLDDFGNFAIGLRFGADGIFRGHIYLSAGSEVSEPSIWLSLIGGFFVIGILSRLKHRGIEILR